MSNNNNSNRDNKKYIIFFPDYFRNTKSCYFFKSKYQYLSRKLENNDILIIYKNKKEEWINSNKFNNTSLTFDYEEEPEFNKLYIHLCGSIYLSDNNYSRYRRNMEKDLLILICGYLGAKEISVIDSTGINNNISLSSDTNIDSVSNKLQISDSNSSKLKNSINETYSLETQNFLFENSKDEFEIKFFEQLNLIDPNLVHYYNICPKLKLLVSKRFNLRILSYSYNLEQEYKNDKIFNINTLLFKYGVGLEYKKSLETNQSYFYKIIFYENDELLFYHKLNENIKNDVFSRLRHEYLIDKKIMIRDFDKNWGGNAGHIYEEVKNYIRENISGETLDEWLMKSTTFKKDGKDVTLKNHYHLSNKCDWFKDTNEVKKWLINTGVNFKN